METQFQFRALSKDGRTIEGVRGADSDVALQKNLKDEGMSVLSIKPVGKFIFEVCQTGPCMISGSDDIIAYIQEKLAIKPGETTKDGVFTLKLVECLGACGYAPMMQVGKIFREHLTKEKVDSIIAEYRATVTN